MKMFPDIAAVQRLPEKCYLIRNTLYAFYKLAIVMALLDT